MRNPSPCPGHYYRIKGETAEAFLQELAFHTFLVDWCFPNPRLPDGKELCDLLVVFEETAIIWQVKDVKLKKDGSLDDKKAEKNLRQLSGARRQLFGIGPPIELRNARRTLQPFGTQGITEVFLVSALLGEMPDLVGLPTEINSHPCHVLTREGVRVLLTELDTISDFCGYLREKERAQEKLGPLVVVGGEKELLAYYLLHERSFADFEGYDDVVLEDGFWEGLQERPEYQAKKKADEISYGWDDLISKVHLGGHPRYELIARELARPNRFDRRCLSQSFYDAHVRAHKLAGERMTFRRVGIFKDVTYCFLFTGDGITRRERREILEALCFIARGNYLESQKVIGIATEMDLRPTCSYDFCLLEIKEWTQEHEYHKRELQSTTGILTNVIERQIEASEYPDVSSHNREREFEAAEDMLT